MSTNGDIAQDALMTLLGEHRVEFEELLKLLIAKGVITDSEWEAAMGQRDARGPRPAEWARRCLEPAHYDGLTAFFGSQPPNGVEP